MPLLKEKPWYSAANSQRVTALCFTAIAAIAVLDAFLVPFLGLGFLYLIPLGFAVGFLSRWQVILLTAICSAFWEAFSNLPHGPEGMARAALLFVSYLFVGLLIRNQVIYRRAVARRLQEFEQDLSTLKQSQEAFDVFFNAAPCAMLAVAADGRITNCNRAAHEIFSVGMGGLPGQSMNAFIPDFERLRATYASAPVKCQARRADGASFTVEIRVSRHTGAQDEAVVVAEPLR